ncbi:MAG: hypothetical protein JNN20_18105 [Betaproteobacteria bacterium]|nr:hypothetical protein [Betaproteobacteria bacterium]
MAVKYTAAKQARQAVARKSSRRIITVSSLAMWHFSGVGYFLDALNAAGIIVKAIPDVKAVEYRKV